MTIELRCYVVWICPTCGWQPDDPTKAWSGSCAAGHPKVALVARRAVLV
jgi:hypothetical protein